MQKGLRRLDCQALAVAAEWLGLSPSPDLWMRVRWLEDEILRLLPAPCNDGPAE